MSNSIPALSPFGVLPPPNRDLMVSDRHGVGIATVLATRTRIPALAGRLREHFGLELPSGPQRVAVGEIAFAATGPGAWLVTHEAGRNKALAAAIEGLAAMTDQTGAYGLLRLSGLRVRELLCKLVPLDLHPRAFQVGDVGATICGHAGATIWRLADEDDGMSVFEIAVYRSFAAYFWRLLSQSASSREYPSKRSAQ